ncbi:GUN4 domain-containing protein, partial [Anabaena sp. UHCC 0204]|uniref:GUN4 domain-containing protein n=1 Tax=Anabaena sp. UHCC 0204 TaxID=2590009 RepID=UPI0015810018
IAVQKRIYQSLGGTRKYNSDIWEKFGDKVGWRKGGSWLYYRDITFDKKAPEGHLPKAMWGFFGWVKVGNKCISSLASRLVNSNI